ncbi:proline--tRNA ligase [Desulfurivibrio dismutans]|uniref:proline--tRNA ligase n=1 Tax=Desulfurivibrio dismutans TaxID=1398908 RepID=UPI0023DAECD2|nr:proline--tRNA ligase [Desulfurivibrio alkaliphilus]MDF1614487.1 proline--tRNA ligase [Desulfurivibrio alkaliphilus]
MRFSQLLLPTLKEDPAEAEVISHKLMLRGGMIRKLTAGVYSYLPLGLAAIRKVEQIVREEMNRAGAQEVLLPMVQPADLWEESGRWEKYGPELLRFKDRHQRESCLGPTHEEVITDLVRKNIHSYRQLPVNLYQIQTKFRDEIRPRFGLMRGREFIMKDGYSFDVDEAGADVTYQKMHDAYQRIFTRCGLAFRAVEADTGTIGGSFSHEFMVLAATGEDVVVICQHCDYAANLEKATAQAEKDSRSEAPKEAEKIATPGRKTVSEVCEFLQIPHENLVKTMIYLADGQPVAVLLRGDHEVQPVKLQNLLGAQEVELADDGKVTQLAGAPAGYLGPVGLKIPLVMDQAVAGLVNFVTGANEADCHLVNVNSGRDFTPQHTGDIRMVNEDDRCPRCGGKLALTRGIEVGHIFKLGKNYSKALNATFLDDQGQSRHFVMGCFGIGVSRTVAAAIEQSHDRDGMIFPLPIAPFQVILLNLTPKDAEITAEAERLYRALTAAGIEVLLDDRDERPGSKFKDADLIGIPIRLMVGKRFKNDGLLELRTRSDGQTSEATPAAAEAVIREMVAAADKATTSDHD